MVSAVVYEMLILVGYGSVSLGICSSSTLIPLKMRLLRFVKTTGTEYPATQSYIVEKQIH